ncbi:unnamed protein product [Cuscuta campestris]|uniref:Uncharacterized protein n=1 Tax=Cuscuta campestris TaxID=132261 RepID=A0A484LD36_9ASTE|nr:unnamed protein product [Cuscuta campestris]
MWMRQLVLQTILRDVTCVGEVVQVAQVNVQLCKPFWDEDLFHGVLLFVSNEAHDGGVIAVELFRVIGSAPQLITIGADKNLVIWDTFAFKEVRKMKPGSKMTCHSVASWCHPRAPNIDTLTCVKDSHILAIEYPTYSALTRTTFCDLSSLVSTTCFTHEAQNGTSNVLMRSAGIRSEPVINLHGGALLGVAYRTSRRISPAAATAISTFQSMPLSGFENGAASSFNTFDDEFSSQRNSTEAPAQNFQLYRWETFEPVALYSAMYSAIIVEVAVNSCL